MVKKYRAWFYSDQPLPELGRTLTTHALGVAFSYHSENEYEWIVLKMEDSDLSWNFSRKHQDGEETASLQTTLLLEYTEKEPPSGLLDTFVERLAPLLQTEIHLGRLKRGEKGKWAFVTEKTIAP